MTTQQERTCSQLVCSYKVEIRYNETCFIWNITTYFVCERIKKMGKTTINLKIFPRGPPDPPPQRLPEILRRTLIVHTIVPPSPVILWIEQGGKPKWLPLNFGYHDTMRAAPNQSVVSIPSTTRESSLGDASLGQSAPRPRPSQRSILSAGYESCGAWT